VEARAPIHIIYDRILPKTPAKVLCTINKKLLPKSSTRMQSHPRYNIIATAATSAITAPTFGITDEAAPVYGDDTYGDGLVTLAPG